MQNIIIYVTFSSRAEAETISQSLIAARLVACANIMSPHQSLYHWEGKIEQGEEVAVIYKTQEGLFEQVRAAILKQHSYECPCIVSWPITAGHAPFLEWITAETRKD